MKYLLLVPRERRSVEPCTETSMQGCHPRPSPNKLNSTNQRTKTFSIKRLFSGYFLLAKNNKQTKSFAAHRNIRNPFTVFVLPRLFQICFQQAKVFEDNLGLFSPTHWNFNNPLLGPSNSANSPNSSGGRVFSAPQSWNLDGWECWPGTLVTPLDPCELSLVGTVKQHLVSKGANPQLYMRPCTERTCYIISTEIKTFHTGGSN